MILSGCLFLVYFCSCTVHSQTRASVLYCLLSQTDRSLDSQTRADALYCLLTQTVHSLMAQTKQMSAAQPLVLSSLKYSRIPRYRAPLSADADGSFVNGPRKTNVCFAAACFSLCSLHYSIKGDVHDTPFIFICTTLLSNFCHSINVQIHLEAIS